MLVLALWELLVALKWLLLQALVETDLMFVSVDLVQPGKELAPDLLM